MFSFFSKNATNVTNHYIDWSRIGNLLRSGNHRYSTEEILTRSAIVSFTAASAFLGHYFNDSEKTNYSDKSAALVCGLVGFIVSHAFVIAPLIKKRCDISRQCGIIKNDITRKLSLTENKPFASLIIAVIDRINTLSLGDEKQTRASETWGRRLSLLTQVQESFSLNQDEFPMFWMGSIDSLMEKLSNNRSNQYYRPR